MNLHFYEATAICFGLISIGMLWYIDHLRDERRELKSELALSNAALDQVNARNQVLFLESMGPKSEPTPEPPHEDQFLEMSNLRRQLDQGRIHSRATEDRLLAKLDENDALKRSNAALRGQITKLTPKKKAKS